MGEDVGRGDVEDAEASGSVDLDTVAVETREQRIETRLNMRRRRLAWLGTAEIKLAKSARKDCLQWQGTKLATRDCIACVRTVCEIIYSRVSQRDLCFGTASSLVQVSSIASDAFHGSVLCLVGGVRGILSRIRCKRACRSTAKAHTSSWSQTVQLLEGS